MKITFYGHACLGIQIEETHIVVDPFITENEKASHIDINTIKADYILITHAHQDHILDVEAIAKRTAPLRRTVAVEPINGRSVAENPDFSRARFSN